MKTYNKKKISNFVIFCAILIFVPFLFCSCATSLGYVAACPEEALLAALKNAIFQTLQCRFLANLLQAKTK